MVREIRKVGHLGSTFYHPPQDPLALFNGQIMPAVASPVNLVFMHGLFGSKKNFTSVASTFAGLDTEGRLKIEQKMKRAEVEPLILPKSAREPLPHAPTPPRVYPVSAFDWRNHGESFHDSHMDLDDLADDLGVYLMRRAVAYHNDMDLEKLDVATELSLSRKDLPEPGSLAKPPMPIVLVGHSMGAMAMMHWIWREHIRIWHAKVIKGLDAPEMTNNFFTNPFYTILGSVTIDMSPHERPVSFNQTIRTIQFLKHLPLDAVHSPRDAENWLMEHGDPELFNQKTLYQTRYHVSNLDFENGKASWRIGLDEIIGGLPFLIWDHGGIDCMVQIKQTLRVANTKRLAENRYIWERPTKITEFPSLFLYGEHSAYFEPEAVADTTYYFHHPNIVKVHGADHFLFMRQKLEFVDTTRDFLRTVEESHNLIR